LAVEILGLDVFDGTHLFATKPATTIPKNLVVGGEMERASDSNP
jgi:hypothetical protein